jgi:uncharacterized protein YdeI (YjbR/CyaY-like superfamily)
MAAGESTDAMKPRFFGSASEFHQWLAANHDSNNELLVGFHKKTSGKKSITYPEALNEALCFGWIDGVRKSLGETSYTIRFTPRKTKSNWSRINVRHVARLKKEGRMQPSGLAAFDSREAKRTGVYSFENQPRDLSPEFRKIFQANKKAWTFFQGQPPSFTRTSSFWVMSAKKEETRIRRLKQLIEASARGKRHGVIEAKPKKSDK